MYTSLYNLEEKEFIKDLIKKENYMNNSDTKTAMLSRSVRLKKDTLDILKIQSEELGIGITVLIREILEKHVESFSVGKN